MKTRHMLREQETKMFEIPDPLAADSAEGGNGAHEPIAEPSLLGIPRLNAGGPHKIIYPDSSKTR
jgi:hypothetical protein